MQTVGAPLFVVRRSSLLDVRMSAHEGYRASRLLYFALYDCAMCLSSALDWCRPTTTIVYRGLGRALLPKPHRCHVFATTLPRYGGSMAEAL